MKSEKPRQSFGKRTAKLFLPVLIGLHVPFLYIQIDSLLNPIDLTAAGKGAMYGSQVFDYVLFPALLVILIVGQWLIILPLWNRVFINSRRVLLSSLFTGIIISVLLGILLGYLTSKTADIDAMIIPASVMSGFVVIYCIGNTITLYLLDRSYIKQLRAYSLKTN
jgi:hypothetical protein